MKSFKSFFLFAALALVSSLAFGAPAHVPVGFVDQHTETSAVLDSMSALSINKADLINCRLGLPPSSGVCPHYSTTAIAGANLFFESEQGVGFGSEPERGNDPTYFESNDYVSSSEQFGGLLSDRDYAVDFLSGDAADSLGAFFLV